MRIVLLGRGMFRPTSCAGWLGRKAGDESVVARANAMPLTALVVIVSLLFVLLSSKTDCLLGDPSGWGVCFREKIAKARGRGRFRQDQSISSNSA